MHFNPIIHVYQHYVQQLPTDLSLTYMHQKFPPAVYIENLLFVHSIIISCDTISLAFALLQDTTMSELKTRVDELKMENEYQLRLKDMNYGEKIKELTDNFLQEIDALKAKNEVRKGSTTCMIQT